VIFPQYLVIWEITLAAVANVVRTKIPIHFDCCLDMFCCCFYFKLSKNIMGQSCWQPRPRSPVLSSYREPLLNSDLAECNIRLNRQLGESLMLVNRLQMENQQLKWDLQKLQRVVDERDHQKLPPRHPGRNMRH